MDQIASFAKQARGLGLKGPIFSCESIFDTAVIRAAQGTLEDAWFISTAVSKDFIEKYQTKFGDVSLMSATAAYYEMAHLVTEAISRGHQGKNLLEHLVIGQRTGRALPSFEILDDRTEKYVNIPQQIVRIVAGEFKYSDAL